MIGIEIAIKRAVLLNVEQAVIREDCFHFDKIKALAALEVKNLETLDEFILKRF
ncbi:MAG: hypothetical protein AB9879_00935 [Methanothrix sp.]